jgi:hypothetical protein
VAEPDDQPLNEGFTETPKEENRARKSWPEEHGGLIFLIIVISVISLVILYDSCRADPGDQRTVVYERNFHFESP